MKLSKFVWICLCKDMAGSAHASCVWPLCSCSFYIALEIAKYVILKSLPVAETIHWNVLYRLSFALNWIKIELKFNSGCQITPIVTYLPSSADSSPVVLMSYPSQLALPCRERRATWRRLGTSQRTHFFSGHLVVVWECPRYAYALTQLLTGGLALIVYDYITNMRLPYISKKL